MAAKLAETSPAPFKDERKKSVTMTDELKEVVDYIKACSDKNTLEYIRDLIYAQESQNRADEMLKNKPKNKLTGKPMEYEDDEP